MDPNTKGWLFVDGQEGKEYKRRVGFPVFSPDSRRVAYTALLNEGSLGVVVIDGQEGSQYDAIIAPREGGGVIFESPDQLHYIARRSSTFYLVEKCLA